MWRIVVGALVLGAVAWTSFPIIDTQQARKWVGLSAWLGFGIVLLLFAFPLFDRYRRTITYEARTGRVLSMTPWQWIDQGGVALELPRWKKVTTFLTIAAIASVLPAACTAAGLGAACRLNKVTYMGVFLGGTPTVDGDSGALVVASHGTFDLEQRSVHLINSAVAGVRRENPLVEATGCRVGRVLHVSEARSAE
jgi:hypothetical protein